MNDTDDQVPTPEDKAKAQAVLDKPEHEFKPDPDGKDPRNEATQDGELPGDE